VSAVPPFDTGALHVSETVVKLAVAERLVGADGADGRGVAVTLVENAPWPIAFRAATRKLYVVPLDSPVIEEVVAVDGLCENVVHVDPPFALNCIV